MKVKKTIGGDSLDHLLLGGLTSAYNIYRNIMFPNFLSILFNFPITLKIMMFITYMIPLIFIILAIVYLVTVFTAKSKPIFYYDDVNDLKRCRNIFGVYACDPMIPIYALIIIYVIYFVFLALIFKFLYNNGGSKKMLVIQSIFLIIYILLFLIIYKGVYSKYLNDLTSLKEQFYTSLQKSTNYEYLPLVLKNDNIDTLQKYIAAQETELNKRNVQLSSDNCNIDSTDAEIAKLYNNIISAHITHRIYQTLKTNVYFQNTGITIDAKLFKDKNGLLFSVNKSTNTIINDDLIHNLFYPGTKECVQKTVLACINELHGIIGQIDNVLKNNSISPTSVFWIIMLIVSVIHAVILIIIHYMNK